MFANESILETDYYRNLVAEQLVNQVRGWNAGREKITKESFTIQFSTMPLSTVLRRGPEGLNPPCICSSGCKHISMFDALIQHANLTDFCPDRNSFLVHRLPCWSTGLKNKVEFTDIPTVYHLFHLFSRGTYWWKGLNGQYDTENRFKLSREARLLLIASTGLPLSKILFMDSKELLNLKCSRIALSRIRNWFITLDGLLISILLGSQGNPEICSWSFFDKIMQTYLKTALGDLFKQGDQDTYYSKLKECRNWMKNLILKERTLLPKFANGDYFSGNFWFYNKVINLLNLNVRRLTPEGLKSVAYLTQTRACGLPPKPVEVRAIEKFKLMTGKEPVKVSELQRFDISRAVDRLCLQIRSSGNYEGLLNMACSQTKVSLSNSASFLCTRESGGKTENARILLNEIPVNCPFFDLETGKVQFTFSKDDQALTPGEKLFHYSILLALTSLTSVANDKPHIGDVRFSTVLEPGKARIITVSMEEHSAVLHPLAHFLSVLLATFPSSKTGLVASNHMWDTFKRIGRNNIPMDDIQSSSNPVSIVMGSEDWESATDGLSPYPVMVILDSLIVNLGIPRFYGNLCKTLLTMPRRIFGKEILITKDYSKPIFIKKNGIFQGDPCCKQVLHLVHLVSRTIARNSLKRIGKISVVPPLRYDIVGNPFGSIPNLSLLKKRLTKEQFFKIVRSFILQGAVVENKATTFELIGLMRKD